MLSLGKKRLIGLIAIAGSLLILVLGVTKPNPFPGTKSIWAQFESAQGLGAIGRDVRLAGVNIGTIGDVKRSGDDAVIELLVPDDLDIRADARVEMRPHTLFEGSSFVDLSPGTPAARPLEAGETIPRAQTSNYVTLDEALRVLRPEIRQSLKDLAGVGARTLRGDAIEGIQRTLKGAPQLTKSLKGPARALQGTHREELNDAIAGLAQTVKAVATREDDLAPLVERLNRTTAALTVDGAGPLDAAVAALPGALAEVRYGAPELAGLVDRLERLGVAIVPVLPDFTTALGEATPLLERSIPVLRDATPLIADTRVIAERLADATPDLEGLVRTLTPVAKTFGASVLPVLLEPSRRGPPVYQQLVATLTAAGAVFRPYQTLEQNPLGSGHVWAIGTYIDFTGPFAGALAGEPASASECANVGAVSNAALGVLEQAGRC